MRIDQLYVKNFRGFEEREFTFHPYFNVLVGDNGTGKTALLEALKVAAGSWLRGIRGHNGKDIRKSDIRESSHYNASSGTYEHPRQFEVVVEAEGVFQTFSPDKEQRFRWKRVRTDSGMLQSGDQDIVDYARAVDDHIRSGEPAALPIIAYYGTDRLHHPTPRTQPDELSKEQDSPFDGYDDCLEGRVHTKYLTAWIDRQERIAFKREGKETEMYTLVKEALSGVIPNARNVDYDPSREEVVVRFEDGSVSPLSNLSDGFRTVLAMVGDLAIRIALLNSRHLENETLEQTHGVVLIDELDLHLHPKWQRRIVDDLQSVFPQIQFITTTHSPFIVQALDEGEFRSLEGDDPVSSIQNKDLDTIAEGLMGLSRTLDALGEDASSHLNEASVQEYRRLRESTLEQIKRMDARIDLERDLDSVAEEVMGVSHAETSRRYQAMKESALEYLRMLDEREDLTSRERLEAFKERLAETVAPYADNPAYQAFLERKRMKEIGE